MSKILKKLFFYVVLVMFITGTTKFIHNQIISRNSEQMVLRFAVASGTYVEENDGDSLLRYIDVVKNYVHSMENQRLDAVIVNGNVTYDGSEEAWECMKEIVEKQLNPETRFLSTVSEKDFIITDDETEDVSEIDSNFTEKITDCSLVIQGFHFVLFSPVFNEYQSKFGWLQNQLETYAKYGDRPVFVIQPGTLQNTYYGSEQWYAAESEELMKLLNCYNNVVDFSGGAATPAHIDESISVKNAIFVNNGNISRTRMQISELGLDTSEDFFAEEVGQISQCRIVEVYGDGRVELLTLDLNSQRILSKVSIFARNGENNVIDIYGKDDHQEKSEFEVLASNNSSESEKKLEVIIPAKAHEKVLLYRIQMKNEQNQVVCEKYRYSPYILGLEKQRKCILQGDFVEECKYVEIIPVYFDGNFGDTTCIEIK